MPRLERQLRGGVWKRRWLPGMRAVRSAQDVDHTKGGSKRRGGRPSCHTRCGFAKRAGGRPCYHSGSVRLLEPMWPPSQTVCIWQGGLWWDTCWMLSVNGEAALPSLCGGSFLGNPTSIQASELQWGSRAFTLGLCGRDCWEGLALPLCAHRHVQNRASLQQKSACLCWCWKECVGKPGFHRFLADICFWRWLSAKHASACRVGIKDGYWMSMVHAHSKVTWQACDVRAEKQNKDAPCPWRAVLSHVLLPCAVAWLSPPSCVSVSIAALATVSTPGARVGATFPGTVGARDAAGAAWPAAWLVGLYHCS